MGILKLIENFSNQMLKFNVSLFHILTTDGHGKINDSSYLVIKLVN